MPRNYAAPDTPLDCTTPVDVLLQLAGGTGPYNALVHWSLATVPDWLKES